MRLSAGQQSRKDFVLDIYEAMMIYFQQETLTQVNSAATVFSDPDASNNEAVLRDAMASAALWEPLWSIRQAGVDALRERHYLHLDYLEGIKLFRTAQRLQGRSFD